MEPPVMQLPIYVKILALVGTAIVIFVLAAWEWVTEWLARSARVCVRLFKSRLTRRGPAGPKPV
jgi:hypothetical protein